MGAHAFEATLRRRLLLLVAPAVLGVGVAAVVVTSRVLDATDRETARSRAEELVLRVQSELTEGDRPEVAIAEVLRATDPSLRAALRGRRLGDARGASNALPRDLAKLRAGECAKADDDAGETWLACASTPGQVEAVAGISVDAHRRVVASLAEWMLVAVALAILGTAAAARYAVRSPLASLVDLVRWSESVVSGDAGRAPPQAEIAEFERLTRAFEALVTHLMDALARERSTSAHIAHELRTPLTTLRMDLESLEPLGQESVRRMLGDVDRLARVIDAILVLSAPAPVGSGAGVVNVADLARELAPEGARVEAPDEALVDADAGLVELALHNLLENAQKYSGAPARAIRVTRTESGVRVSVIDDGPGVDDLARARMFDRFWRGGAGDGSGLGLALVRAVAERYGGTAVAAPNPSGPGLDVSMTFGRVLGWHSGADPAGSKEVGTG